MKMISDTQIIYIGVDASSSHGVLINVDPSSTTPTVNWQKLLSIPGGSAASMNRAAATTNADKSHVYAAVPIGTSTSATSLVFMVIEESTGSLVVDPLVSSEVCADVDEIYYFSSKVYVLVQFSEARLLVFDPTSSSFATIIKIEFKMGLAELLIFC